MTAPTRTSCRQQCGLLAFAFLKTSWERHDPNFLPANHREFFHSPPFRLPCNVLFIPLEAAKLSCFFLLFHIPGLSRLQYASPHPTAVFIIPVLACFHFRELCLERQKKTATLRTPPTSNPDGSHSFQMEQRDATHAKLRDVQLLKIQT